MDYTTLYRDTLLALTGEDLFDQAPFRAVIDYVLTVLGDDNRTMLISGLMDEQSLLGAEVFYNRVASKYQEGHATYLEQLTLALAATDFFHPNARNAHYLGAVWGFLSHDPAVAPVAPERPAARLAFYEDSGFVHYRDSGRAVSLAIKCGPWDGYYGYRQAPGPCDRLISVPAAGHFSLHLEGRAVLCSPDSGYRMHTAMRNCLLIDGHGQYGDIGYPMSIPSWRWRGEQVLKAEWDPETGRGIICLDLAPAYPEEAGVAEYRRDFLLFPDCRLVVRDRVTLDEPRDLAWLFQGTREEHPVVEDLTARFGVDPALHLHPRPLGVSLRAAVHETEVVYGYSSRGGFQPFAHVRYDSTEKTAHATVEFVLEW
jgi:hypothetical protein